MKGIIHSIDIKSLVKEVESGTSKINWAVHQFTEDQKLLKLQEDSDLTGFLASLDDDDPYGIREVPAINGVRQYIVMARANKLPFMQEGVTKKQGDDEVVRAMARQQLDVYAKEFPWTKPIIDEGLQKIERGNCHNCGEKRLLAEVAQIVSNAEENRNWNAGLSNTRTLSEKEEQAIRPVFGDLDNQPWAGTAVSEYVKEQASGAVPESEDVSMWGAREPCPLCTVKHLSQAIVLLGESMTGYPLHRWIAVGHMAEAEAEAPSHSMANRIRAQRLTTMDELDYIPYLTDILAELDAIIRQ